MKIVDGDSHFIEPLALFLRYDERHPGPLACR